MFATWKPAALLLTLFCLEPASHSVLAREFTHTRIVSSPIFEASLLPAARSSTSFGLRPGALAPVNEGDKLYPGRFHRQIIAGTNAGAHFFQTVASSQSQAAASAGLPFDQTPSNNRQSDAHPQTAANYPGTEPFGTVSIGNENNRFITIKNPDLSLLTIESIALSGPDAEDFRFGNGRDCAGSLPPQSSCEVDLEFAPHSAGRKSAILTIVTNEASSSGKIRLTGFAITPAQLSVSPDRLLFNTPAVGVVSPPQTVTLTNTGQAELEFSTGPFTGFSKAFTELSNTCDFVLRGGESCSITIAFSAPASGAFTDELYGFWKQLEFGVSGSQPIEIPLAGRASKQRTKTLSDAVFLLGDFDGDGQPDFATWRWSDGLWTVIPSSAPQQPITQQWGLPGDTPVPGDYDGDGKADFAVWRPTEGNWYVLPSSSPAHPVIQQLGTPYDLPITGDFDGDRKNDFAVWHPVDATWHIQLSSTPGRSVVRQWGLPGDLPVSGDFNGDGIQDLAVWRPTEGSWYVLPTGNSGSTLVQQWGLPGDVPVAADYDGDGKTDFGVWRPTDRNIYVLPSSRPGESFQFPAPSAERVLTIDPGFNIMRTPVYFRVDADYDGDGRIDSAIWNITTGQWICLLSTKPGVPLIQQWGLPGDVPVAGDYDGDGRIDLAVWRPTAGSWYVLPSSSPGQPLTKQWGLPGDAPVPADYDGDGTTDFAVWRPFEGNWYVVLRTSPDQPFVQQWGLPGDVPVPADYDSDYKTNFAIWRPSETTWYVLRSGAPLGSTLDSYGVYPIYTPQDSYFFWELNR